jgi:multidrug transporter EmrE-like cation transporter
MTAGSIAATILVLARSQVDGLVAVYALWIGLGLVMAAVLYEPAFTVIAKWFHGDAERRRALTALTLVGALASFIFLPVSQALVATVASPRYQPARHCVRSRSGCSRAPSSSRL